MKCFSFLFGFNFERKSFEIWIWCSSMLNSMFYVYCDEFKIYFLIFLVCTFICNRLEFHSQNNLNLWKENWKIRKTVIQVQRVTTTYQNIKAICFKIHDKIRLQKYQIFCTKNGPV